MTGPPPHLIYLYLREGAQALTLERKTSHRTRSYSQIMSSYREKGGSASLTTAPLATPTQAAVLESVGSETSHNIGADNQQSSSLGATHGDVPPALLFSPAPVPSFSQIYEIQRRRWSPSAALSRNPTDLANSLVDELGLGLHPGGVMGVHAGASRLPRRITPGQGLQRDYASTAFLHTARHLAKEQTNSFEAQNALTSATGRYRTTQDQMLDVLKIVDNASHRRQEAYLKCKMNFLRQASILEDLAGIRSSHSSTQLEERVQPLGLESKNVAVAEPLSALTYGHDYDSSSRSILESKVLRRCNETFSLLSHKDGDGKVDLQDLLGTLLVVPDILHRPLTHIMENVEARTRAESGSAEGSTADLTRPTVANEMWFLKETCAGQVSWLDFKSMFHVNPAVRRKAREHFTVTFYNKGPSRVSEKDHHQSDLGGSSSDPRRSAGVHIVDRGYHTGMEPLGTKVKANGGSNDAYFLDSKGERKLRSSIVSTHLVNEGKTNESIYGEQSILRDNEAEENDCTLTSHHHSVGDKSSITKNVDGGSLLEKKDSPSRNASEEKGNENENENIVDMYKVVAQVFGGRGGRPGTQGRSSRLLSIYDGITEYSMHTWCESPADSLGFFVHKSRTDALRTGFPRGSKLLSLPRCLLRCRVHTSNVTSHSKYGVKTLTTTRLRPVEMWEIDLVYPSPRANGLPPYWDVVRWHPSGTFK